MGRRPLPARLWLRDDTEPHEWLILDNVAGKRVQQGTGCGAGDRDGAEKFLARYVANKTARANAEEALKPAIVERVPFTQVPIAEAVRYGMANIVPRMKRPREGLQRLSKVLDIVEDDLLGHIDVAWCGRFEAEYGSAAASRRALEDLRAAVNAMEADAKILGVPKFTMPGKGAPRPDYLSIPEIIAIALTAFRERDSQEREHGPRGSGDYRVVTTSRRRWKHLLPFILMGVLTCSRSSKIYEASYVKDPLRPWVDLKHGIYTRLAEGEVASFRKRAPEVPLPDRLVRVLRRWSREKGPGLRFGADYVVQYAGRPVDCRKAFQACVDKALKEYPDLFWRRDGENRKQVVRHTLRHTGVTLLSQMGVPADQICSYAGMEREVYDNVYKHNDPEYMAALMGALGGRTTKHTLNARIPKRHQPYKKPSELAAEDVAAAAAAAADTPVEQPKAKRGRKRKAS